MGAPSETGLYYHGARYYAPWLGRWTAADPLGVKDGVNLYRYSRDNPICYSDPGGTETKKPFAEVGSADYEIGTRTDAQLYKHMQGMSAEQRGSFIDSASGAFKARAQAFSSKYSMNTVHTLPEVTVEGNGDGGTTSADSVELTSEEEDAIVRQLVESDLQGVVGDARSKYGPPPVERYKEISARIAIAAAESIPVLGAPLLVAGAMDSEASVLSRVVSGLGAVASVMPLVGAIRSSGSAIEVTGVARAGVGTSEPAIPALSELPQGVAVPIRAGEPLAIPRALTPNEMAALTNTTGNIEFSQTFSNGQHWLTRADFSTPNRVLVRPWKPGETQWISHSHPAGYSGLPSRQDKALLRELGQGASRVVRPNGSSIRYTP